MQGDGSSEKLGAHITGVVLAAGAGRRFGMPKALIQLEGRLLVERAVDTLRSGGCVDVLLVLGAAADRVIRAAALDGVRIIVNAEWDAGISSSLRVALRTCEGARAVVVTLVDQPGVTPAVVRRLIATWQLDERPVTVASYGGARRNPVLFGAQVFADVIASVSGDVGARFWLDAHPELVRAVEVGDVGESMDLDTPTDLKTRVDRMRNRPPS